MFRHNLMQFVGLFVPMMATVLYAGCASSETQHREWLVQSLQNLCNDATASDQKWPGLPQVHDTPDAHTRMTCCDLCYDLKDHSRDMHDKVDSEDPAEFWAEVASTFQAIEEYSERCAGKSCAEHCASEGRPWN